MKHPDNDDDLNELLARLRAAPPAADPARVAVGLETRVLARLRAARGRDLTRWFWRWSAVFGVAATICTVLVVQNYLAFTDESLAALDEDITLLEWLY